MECSNVYRQGIAVELSRPAIQKQSSDGTNLAASAGDVCSGMSSAAQEYCYNEVTYTPSLTSPAAADLSQQGRGHHETLCLCQTILSESPSLSDYASPSIQLCQINRSSSGQNFSEIPTFCPDKSQTLTFGTTVASPRCAGVQSPSESAGAPECAAFTLNCPRRYLPSAALQDYVLKYSSTTAEESSLDQNFILST